MLYKYNAQVLRVVDGDTLDLDVDLGFKVHVNIRVRLTNIDTPEIYGVKHESEEYKKGIEASEYTQDWVNQHGSTGVVVETLKDRTGKYGRWLATIYSGDESKCLNEDLVTSGHATVLQG